MDPNFNRHRLLARWALSECVLRDPAAFDIGGLKANARLQLSLSLSGTLTLSPTTMLIARARFSRSTQIGVDPSFDRVGRGFPASLVAQMQQAIFPVICGTDAMRIGASEGN